MHFSRRRIPSRSRLAGFAAMLAGPLAATLPAAAGTAILTPDRDNTLIQYSGTGAQFSNGLGDLFVGRTSQDGPGAATARSIRRGLLRFDIAGAVPAGSTITSVALAMREIQGNNGDQTVSLHRVTHDWGEGTSFFNGGQGVPATVGDATWVYATLTGTSPALAGTPWSTPGGDYVGTASGSVVVSTAAGAGQTFTWSSATNPGLVTDVQAWLDASATNFGWIMIGNEAQGLTSKRFNSRESTLSPVVPPALTITFVPEPGSAVALLGGVAVIVVRLAWLGAWRM